MTKAESPAPTSRRIDLAIEIPAVVVVFVMMAHITANALLRTFANNPIENTLEIVQYWYMPIIAYLGFIAAQLRGQHIAADLIYEMIPTVTRRFVLAAMMVLTAVTMAAFAWFTWGDALHKLDIRQTGGLSDVPTWPVYFLLPAAFASLTAQFLWASVAALRGGDEHRTIDEVVSAELAEAGLEKGPTS